MKVLKFGGTSLGTPQRMQEVLDLCMEHTPCCIVLSAVSGTTNSLQEIADLLYGRRKQEAYEKIDELLLMYKAYIKELFVSEKLEKEAYELIEQQLVEIRDLELITKKEENTILAKGEMLSTTLFSLKAKERQVSMHFFKAPNCIATNEDGEPDLGLIKKSLQELLAQEKHEMYLTQGYICKDANGDLSNLNRGGSDYTAALIGEAINAEEIQIWTDIDGMHNNDPRIVEGTVPLSHLSYNEASELAYFGAKILHPQSVFPAERANIPLIIKNTMQPDAPGTQITQNKTGSGIKSIAAKDGITAIKIRSSRMLMAHGFLSRLFGVFDKHKTAIDMITTSEVAVSLTIDDDSHLGNILEDLQALGEVEVDVEQSIICVVGDLIADSKGHARDVFNALEDIPVRMVSYGGSRHNISVLVNTHHKTEALRALHKALFQTTLA